MGGCSWFQKVWLVALMRSQQQIRSERRTQEASSWCHLQPCPARELRGLPGGFRAMLGLRLSALQGLKLNHSNRGPLLSSTSQASSNKSKTPLVTRFPCADTSSLLWPKTLPRCGPACKFRFIAYLVPLLIHLSATLTSFGSWMQKPLPSP